MRIVTGRLIVVIEAAALALAGYTALPSARPASSEVVDHAQVGGSFRYVLRDVDAKAVPILAKTRPNTFNSTFGDHRLPPSQRVGVGGTTVGIVWEAAIRGLFSSPAMHLAQQPGPNQKSLSPLAPVSPVYRINLRDANSYSLAQGMLSAIAI